MGNSGGKMGWQIYPSSPTLNTEQPSWEAMATILTHTLVVIESTTYQSQEANYFS